MSERFGARASMQPSLLAVSTSVAQTERLYECPAGVGRVLCAANGGCLLMTAEKTVHLIGARMVFLFGPMTYRLSEPSEDFMLTRLDVAMKPGKCCEFDINELETAFPQLPRLLQTTRECVVFYDNFAFVMSSLQNVHTFSLYDTPDKEAQIMLTLSFLLAAIASSSWDEDIQARHYSKHVRNALQYIHENYMCNITTTDIAEAAGVHIGHLHRIFPAETGSRVGEYLTDLRISKAKSLLMRTDMPTTEIARRVGVSTLQYFSRLFKQKTGMTPQAFRKSYNLTCAYDDSRYEYITGGGAAR